MSWLNFNTRTIRIPVLRAVERILAGQTAPKFKRAPSGRTVEGLAAPLQRQRQT